MTRRFLRGMKPTSMNTNSPDVEAVEAIDAI
jgi:hypothetical protein